MPIMHPEKILQRNKSPTDTPTDAQVLTFDNATQLWVASDAGGSGVGFAKVIKTADETIDTDTTLHDDLELVVALNASKTYLVIMFITIIGDGTADIKYRMTVPTGATAEGIFGNWASSVSTADHTPTSSWAVANDTNGQISMLAFRVITDTTAGNLNFQWAQNNSNANDTTVRQGSTMIVWEN